MTKSNFDRYLDQQLKNPNFAALYCRAGDAWDVAAQIAELRRQAGLSQGELARRLKTSQQQISRMESPAYEGHSLRMLRRVAAQLKARIRVVVEPDPSPVSGSLRESPSPYKAEVVRRRTKSS